MRAVMLVCSIVFACQTASAALMTESVDYQAGGTSFKGYIAYDDSHAGKLPAVIVVHEWWGHNQHARNQADRLAKLGYIGFAIDMYGEGKVAAHPKDAGEMAAAVRSNPKEAHARFMAAYDFIKKHPKVDSEHVAAIGYCFGGNIVLEMARRGVDLDAVTSFHGALTNLEPGATLNVKAKVLVCHGGDDAFVPQKDIDNFKKEMDAAKADYQFLVLEGAKHSFTNPDADKVGMEGLAYSADADAKSWEAMSALLKRVFGK